MVDVANLTGEDADVLKKTGVRPDHELTGAHWTPQELGLPSLVRLQIPLSMALEADILAELAKLQGEILQLRRRYGTSQTQWAFELKVLIQSANARLAQMARLGRKR